MGIYRLYSETDGESHLEEMDLSQHSDLTEARRTANITFREWASGHFIDWHPAPRRQYIISLSGGVEIGLGDGTSVVYNPGDARLVEDTTGRGHTTRVIGNESCIHVVIPLAD